MCYDRPAVRLVQYETSDGRVPFARWFNSLDARAAAKINSALAQMELGNFGDHKSVGGGVWERRINFAKGYRVYFARDGQRLILLLTGGDKSRQQADIAEARRLWTDYKHRKRQANEPPETESAPPRKRKRR